MKTRQKIYLPFKRLFGLIGALVGIVICFVFLWIWVLPINFFVTKGHPFFLHKRYGKNKKIFGMVKFRSMKLDANPNIPPNLITQEQQDEMETKFGKFLRASSIDETPQLFNILIGQMSFIGPRPGAAVNEEDLVEYRDAQECNPFSMKPGITGLAQVKMKREHNPKLKAEFDSEYVKKISFFLDIKIFFKTLVKIFSDLKGK